MKKSLVGTLSCLLLCTSCASFSHRAADSTAPQETDAQKIERLQAQNKELSTTLAQVSTKLESIETKLGSMNDRVEANQNRLENILSNQRAKPAPVRQLPTEGAVRLPPPGDEEAEGSFASDEAVRKYRQAMISFDSRSFPDAVLGFSAFVDQYPDHPLAGSAQYYLGESYFKQNEYKLATREFQRVITTYDRSPQIAETLRDLAISEEKTGQGEEAARHRQLLTSLFPHSPAALRSAPAMEEPHASTSHAAVKPGGAKEAENEAAKNSIQNPGKKSEGELDAPPPTAPISSAAGSVAPPASSGQSATLDESEER